MQKDIKDLRIRFVLIIVAIVAVILGLILGILCWIINIGLQRLHIEPLTMVLVMRGIIRRAILIFVLGVGLFAAIAFFASKWMVKPVENTWKEQKQFVSDASHELKTPLTVITTNAELLQTKDLTVDDQNKYTDNIVLVSHQMRVLIDDLLNLARIEKGEEAGFKRFNYSEVISTFCLTFEPIMYELGLNLVENITPNVYVYGSDYRLGQLAAILLDNASKYSLKGDVIIDLHIQKNMAQLIVSNKSEPLTDVQLKDIFKRFYRTDESHTAKESFGLGLSIAKGICEAHKARIHAEYHDDSIYFIVNIPLNQKQA